MGPVRSVRASPRVVRGVVNPQAALRGAVRRRASHP